MGINHINWWETRQLLFGGVSTRNYGALVDGGDSYGGAERDYETVPVPGRDGDLTIDNGRYLNVDVPYTIYFDSSKNMEFFRSEILSLKGYQRLEDFKRPEEFRMARLKQFTPTVSGVNNRHGTVSVVFDCKPQRFLKDGERAVTITPDAPSTLYNRYGTDAKPLIRAYGAGKVTIGDNPLTIQAHEYEYMEIDCERCDAYYNGENLNSKLIKEGASFPFFGRGETKITVEGLERVLIYPRWWKL